MPLNTLLIQAAIAAGVFLAGMATGIKWHAGQDAIAARQADELRQADARQQRALGDTATLRHAQAVATLNDKLGAAREQIASLSGRECLSSDTVGMLNSIGVEPMRAPAAYPASAPAAPAAGAGLRFATERDTATAIAVCRARYAEVADQLNQVLDIEDGRHPQAAQP